MLSLDELKTHLRIDGNDEDGYLSSLCTMVSEVVEADLNRKLYADQAALDADSEATENALIVNETIKAAGKLLAGHFYENRESTTVRSLKEAPMSYRFLIDKYRWHPV
ncbi:head-tail connector protein [Litoribrevibacter albus]|uniref:Phage gp6-like head-tail connector protein n=1 Tax=Litoribrevibacter albus TaxID=1473156 RepID=A0AA37W6K7_9GAMM|nr:head-tail connector protein [Litoribrevibacter albus]GLQ31660.1 hypothetical protein GCM10007876_21390 [Litoribrevibacter albus]